MILVRKVDFVNILSFVIANVLKKKKHLHQLKWAPEQSVFSCCLILTKRGSV